MKIVTVIIPIYCGKYFISGLCSMLERNAINAKKEDIGIEAIFIDDSPQEELDSSLICAGNFVCKILRNEKNEGIHYSRVRGVKEATGDYIFFLDQDDIISEQLVKQLVNAIGCKDAVVSNGFVYGKKLFRDVQDIELNMKRETKFPYPGQVLLRKESIPKQWLENVMRTSCADDTYLWILMLRQNLSIVYVDKKLYCHVSTGENTSDKHENMLNSLQEMHNYLSNDGYIDKDKIEDALKKWKLPEDNWVKSTREIKTQFQLQMLDRWLEVKEQNFGLCDYLHLYGIKRIIIYGMGILGRHLYSEFRNAPIEICGVMEKEKREDMSVSSFKIGDTICECDAIIITVVDEYEKIKSELLKYYTCRIISLEAMLTSACKLD